MEKIEHVMRKSGFEYQQNLGFSCFSRFCLSRNTVQERRQSMKFLSENPLQT